MAAHGAAGEVNAAGIWQRVAREQASHLEGLCTMRTEQSQDCGTCKSPLVWHVCSLGTKQFIYALVFMERQDAIIKND